MSNKSVAGSPRLERMALEVDKRSTYFVSSFTPINREQWGQGLRHYFDNLPLDMSQSKSWLAGWFAGWQGDDDANHNVE